MNILMLNGSPRKAGNTSKALYVVKENLLKHMPTATVDLLDLAKMPLKACLHCDSCMKSGGTCVLPGENANIIKKMSEADVIIFGSPVYWWGISAHLKMAMDSMYSKDAEFKTQNKKIGLITVGHHETTDPQYRIIQEQFQCISNYLGWDLVFSKAFSTPEKDTLANEPVYTEQLDQLWTKLV